MTDSLYIINNKINKRYQNEKGNCCREIRNLNEKCQSIFVPVIYSQPVYLFWQHGLWPISSFQSNNNFGE